MDIWLCIFSGGAAGKCCTGGSVAEGRLGEIISSNKKMINQTKPKFVSIKGSGSLRYGMGQNRTTWAGMVGDWSVWDGMLWVDMTRTVQDGLRQYAQYTMSWYEMARYRTGQYGTGQLSKGKTGKVIQKI